MKIINFGSLGHEFVYEVDKFVLPGEIPVSECMQQYPGGKGFNQSIALARAGAKVMHVGLIGDDGRALKNILEKNQVDVSLVKQISGPSGQAIIQKNSKGENKIILNAGANHKFSLEHINQAFDKAEPGDIVLIQNEINAIGQIIELAKSRKCPVVFNVTPATDEVSHYPLNLVDIFVINESEGKTLTGEKTPEEIFKSLLKRFPKAAFLMTLGPKGSKYHDSLQRITVPGEVVQVVDTTAAGDTFTGYFLNHWIQGHPIESCLKIASNAAAICIGKRGASASIPTFTELN